MVCFTIPLNRGAVLPTFPVPCSSLPVASFSTLSDIASELPSSKETGSHSELELPCSAGAIFIAIDSLVSYTVINRWIRRRWKELAAPGASQEELEKSIPMISMRIVGMIHILIQVLHPLSLRRPPIWLLDPA